MLTGLDRPRDTLLFLFERHVDGSKSSSFSSSLAPKNAAGGGRRRGPRTETFLAMTGDEEGTDVAGTLKIGVPNAVKSVLTRRTKWRGLEKSRHTTVRPTLKTILLIITTLGTPSVDLMSGLAAENPLTMLLPMCAVAKGPPARAGRATEVKVPLGDMPRGLIG